MHIRRSARIWPTRLGSWVETVRRVAGTPLAQIGGVGVNVGGEIFRLGVGVIACGVIGGSLLVGTASGVSAADVSTGCAEADGLYWNSPGGGRDWSFAAGDQLSITAEEPDNNGNASYVELTLDNVLLDTVSFPGTMTYTFTEATSGYFHWQTTPPWVAPTWTFVCVAAPVPPAVVSNGPFPPPWHQSYGRPGQEVGCVDSWHPSWAQWPNGGTGGFVCNRSLVYDRVTGTWAFSD